MRQSPRGKHLRPMFDSLDHRIAPSSMAAAPTSEAPAETSTSTASTPADGTTSIGPAVPKGGGAGPAKP